MPGWKMKDTGRSLLLPIVILVASAATGQEDRPGVYSDEPGASFFAMLRAGSISYAPKGFEETIETSTVIARGNFVDVIPGRSVSSYRMRAGPEMNTIFLKIVPSDVLKGPREDYYLVEILARTQVTAEIADELYAGEFLFFLLPASNLLVDADISLSSEAQREWDSGKPLYSLTMRSTLFAMSGAGQLTSPIEPWRLYTDLYRNVRSLDELATRIGAVLAALPADDDSLAGGSREWGETDDLANERQGLVRERYDSGQLRSEVNYFRGREHGLARYWYESGQLQAEMNFTNGEPDGPARYWFGNGRQALQSTYENGERIRCRAWAEDGSPTDCP